MEKEIYAGHNDDARRNDTVTRAVEAANTIILEESDGTVEETDYLTSRVMREFVQMVHNRIESNIIRADQNKRVKES